MATQKKTSSKTLETKLKAPRKPRTTKPKVIRSPEVEKELAALKEETAILHEENAKLAEQYGKMLETSTNIKFRANAMLGQILKALYIMGIGPDEIQAKCQQMFRKKVVAD